MTKRRLSMKIAELIVLGKGHKNREKKRRRKLVHGYLALS